MVQITVVLGLRVLFPLSMIVIIWLHALLIASLQIAIIPFGSGCIRLMAVIVVIS